MLSTCKVFSALSHQHSNTPTPVMSLAVIAFPPSPVNGWLLICTGNVPVVPVGTACDTLMATNPFHGLPKVALRSEYVTAVVLTATPLVSMRGIPCLFAVVKGFKIAMLTSFHYYAQPLKFG